MSDSGNGGNALEVFAGWLSRREEGELVEIDALVRRHPQLAAELMELHATWKGLVEASEPDGPSLHERLKSRFGAASVPDVSLRARVKGEPEADLSSALIAQLTSQRSRFGRYKIRGEVARGGMGAILKIWDEELRRHLAMKVILGQADAPKSGDTPPVDSSKVARFLEEAQVTGQLDHPGIVPVHELGLDPAGRLYFTMKLVKGESLNAVFDHVRDGVDEWTQARALNVLQKVCEAMAYAHDKGVIHRDLKPANVMVGKFGEVHVMDWGLARIEGQKERKDVRIRAEPSPTAEIKGVRADQRGQTPDSPLCTMDGDVVGTPAYMPPEQAAGRVAEVGPQSDVYALGAMLYHLLAGHPPYLPRGTRANNYATWSRVQEGPPTPIAQLAPQTPAELLAICDKAMARDWRHRYRDMSELAADLSAYLQQRVVRAYETGAWAEARKWVQRNKSLAAAIAAALLLAIGGFVWVSLVQSQAREQIEQKNIVLAATTKTAQENERLATQKANDVLSLSAIQDLKELEAHADALWPAYPENLPKYEAWLADARLLIEGQAADESKGIKRRPSLAEHEAQLAALRQRANPLSPDQIEADRIASAGYAEWNEARARLLWMRRMLGEEPWPAEADVEAEVASETLPADATALGGIARSLTTLEPGKIEYGRELRGLVLAQRAVKAATESERAWTLNLLAWALLRCGRFDEAIEEEQRGLNEAAGAPKEKFSRLLNGLQNLVAQWKTEEGRLKQTKEITALRARVMELEHDVDERRTYDFEDAQDRWWHAQLTALVRDLQLFKDEGSGGLFSSGISQEHGWGINLRSGFARTIEERSVSGPEAKRRWDEAIAAISVSPKYVGMKLEPQLGLLPISADPDSGLWEFAHLQSGEPAERGPDGKLVLKESMGLVLVLIPGGTFWMGAQRTNPNGPNFDAKALPGESPVHRVTLSPYFLSKYEMTQGQWGHFTSWNPSGYNTTGNFAGHQITLLNPVEQVSWAQCMKVMFRLGLIVPSEAQWEYGCRAGTDTPWWTGAERESLRGKINIADRTANEMELPWAQRLEWPDLVDGWVTHAAVGSFPANPFGLHEVHGNVFEWCCDCFGLYSMVEQVDPIAPWTRDPYRVFRGGSFMEDVSATRSSARDEELDDFKGPEQGLRPARALQPSAHRLDAHAK